jgi:CheY-like chemotaxis protein
MKTQWHFHKKSTEIWGSKVRKYGYSQNVGKNSHFRQPASRDMIRELPPDVALVDFNMPHLNGIELTKIPVSQAKETKVLILNMYNEDIYRFREPAVDFPVTYFCFQK